MLHRCLSRKTIGWRSHASYGAGVPLPCIGDVRRIFNEGDASYAEIADLLHFRNAAEHELGERGPV